MDPLEIVSLLFGLAAKLAPPLIDLASKKSAEEVKAVFHAAADSFHAAITAAAGVVAKDDAEVKAELEAFANGAGSPP